MTKKITQTFAFKYLKYPEEAEFHLGILELAARVTPAAIGAEDIIPLYANAVDMFNRSIGLPRYSEYTPGINELHDKMIRALDGLSCAVGAVELSYNPAEADAGASLRRVLNNYKNARSNNYEAAAAEIHCIVDEFRSDKHAAQISGNNLERWVDALESELTEYTDLVRMRFEERGAIPRGAAKKWHALCQHYWTTLRERVNSHIYIGAPGNAAIDAFVGAVHAIMNRYAALAVSPGRGKVGVGDAGVDGGVMVGPYQSKRVLMTQRTEKP